MSSNKEESESSFVAKEPSPPNPFSSSVSIGKEMMMSVLSNRISKDELKPGDHIYSWRKAYVYAHHVDSLHLLDLFVASIRQFCGIYVGDGKVIHFTRGAGQEIGTGTVLDRLLFSSSTHSSDTPCPICGDQSNSDGVISSCLDCFLSGGELYRFQYDINPIIFLAKARGGTCTLAKSDPPEDVIHRAKFLLQNGFGDYNIFRNNCEDFAIYCKTGLLIFTSVSVGRSGQACSIVAAASAVVSSPLRFLTTSFSGLAAVGYGVYCVSRLVSDMGVRRDVTKIPVESLVTPSGLIKPEVLPEIAKEE
ncbi:hypothetical protein LguiA_013821 [Lonicera macranthoides]